MFHRKSATVLKKDLWKLFDMKKVYSPEFQFSVQFINIYTHRANALLIEFFLFIQDPQAKDWYCESLGSIKQIFRSLNSKKKYFKNNLKKQNKLVNIKKKERKSRLLLALYGDKIINS